MECSFRAVVFWSHFVVDWHEKVDTRVLERHSPGHWTCIWYRACYKFSAVSLHILQCACCCLKRVQKCWSIWHSIWDQPYKLTRLICKFASLFTTLVVLVGVGILVVACYQEAEALVACSILASPPASSSLGGEEGLERFVWISCLYGSAKNLVQPIRLPYWAHESHLRLDSDAMN